ncbi:putative alpha-1,2-mannosidase [Motilibacter peucedani]|uniref:Putative alpha-1,2-mannosidase n=1 Tax=Motilibacter peucedani TaxID=598650 RepID=A0A420XTR4_9ACTN|nr:GH92 family glycosyl hydrolase [Motilibacter peucedani]RKS80262.1 putative alpha-1,2-mannosidase [Motilibacter peucedani]
MHRTPFPRRRPAARARLAASAVAVAVTAATVAAAPASAAAQVPLVVDPAAYVNPMIGTTNAGNVYPGAVVPFGLLSWSPQTSFGNQVSNPAPGGYDYTAPRIRGFGLTHLSGVGCSGAEGELPVMPYVGAVDSSPASDTGDAKYASTYAHTDETASAGYYGVRLASGAGVELTSTARTGSGRFAFPGDKPASMLFRTSMAESGSAGATVSIDRATGTVSGSVDSGNFCGPQSENNRKDNYTVYFTAHFDTPFAAVGTWKDGTLSPGSTSASGGTGYDAGGNPNAGRGSGGYVTFAPGTTHVGLKVAVSYVSVAGAEKNLAAENPGAQSFDATRAAAHAQWKDALGRVQIGGGTDDQRSVFYTALYHAMLEPTLASDVDGRYQGADRETHSLEPGQHAEYATFSGWDQYRAQIQLLSLLDPGMASDYAQSLFNLAKQRGGNWDRWLLQNGKTSVMSGDPAAAAVAAVYAFGGRSFDVRGAFDSLVKAATVATPDDLSDAGCNVECVGQRPSVDRYQQLGHVPSDDCHCWGAASETLEDAAADYGLSQLAGALGETGTAETFLARSQSWRNVFDPTATTEQLAIPGTLRQSVTSVKASDENPPDEVGARLNDGDAGSKWLTPAIAGWVQYSFASPVKVVSYALTSANDAPGRDPRDWTLQGSNDGGKTWTTVDSRSGQTFADRFQTKQFSVTTPGAYSAYRLNVTANSGEPYTQLAELQLTDDLAGPVPNPLSWALPGTLTSHVREISASEENPPGEVASSLNDLDVSSKWLTHFPTGRVQYRLDGPRTVIAYALTSANDAPTRDPRDWALQGSNDGTTWTTVDSQNGQAFSDRGQTRQFSVAHPGSFTYYRLDVTANSGAPLTQLAELQLSDDLNGALPPAPPVFSGYMRDRSSTGAWSSGFTPATENGFVEGTSARYTWMVYSDVTSLARAMGGNEVAVKRLDDFFHATNGDFDLTGRNATKYDPTNEPDIHAPYIYSYLGAPWKTQATVRAEIDRLWTNTTGGIPGNDDAGTMSSWLVFSALGMYPGVPTRADLVLTTPLFPRAVVHRANGVDITIDAPDASADNAYIAGVSVDGQTSTKPWVPASFVAKGGTISYALRSTADTSWGAAAADAPPQTSYASAVDAVGYDLATRGDVAASLGRDVTGLASALAAEDGSAASAARIRALLRTAEAEGASKLDAAGRDRLRALLQSGLGLPTGVSALRQATGELARSGDIASSSARDLQALLTTAESAQAAGDATGLRTALQQFRSAVAGAKVSKVSAAAKERLAGLLDPLLAG